MNFAKWIIATYLVIQTLFGAVSAGAKGESPGEVFGAALGVAVFNGVLLWLLIAYA